MKTRLLQFLVLSLALGCAKRGANGNAPESPAEITRRVAELAGQGDSAGIAAILHRTCDEFDKRTTCIESQLVPLAEQGKVKLAMGALGELADLDPDIRNDGHVFAHGIGIAAGKATNDVASAFSQCSESFQSGCYHGVIQAYFGKLDTITANDANALCAPYRENEGQRWIRFQCVHGMGHGLTMLYKHDLKQGLEGCDLLSDEWDRHSCYGGAFMENIVNVTNPHHPASALGHGDHGGTDSSGEHAGHDMGEMKPATPAFKAIDPADQQYPCSALGAKYQTSCYGMQTSVMLHNNGGDMAATAKSCGEAPANMRSICYASLGRDISSYARQNHNEAVRMCSVARDIYQPWCYLGVVKNLIDLNARPADGMAFCKSISGESNKQLCYAAVGEQILVLEPDVEKRRAHCATTELAYRAACLYGANVNRELPPRLEQVYRSIENRS
jgi:hypothetical protein